MQSLHRRWFLQTVTQGTLITALGPTLAVEMGFAPRLLADDSVDSGRINFGALEPLVCMMQESPVATFQAELVKKISDGLPLSTLIAAGALANARSFGGEDYIGFHTFMALMPALRMASMMPVNQQPLPILKVLLRNLQRIQENGGPDREVLHGITGTPTDASIPADPVALQRAIRQGDTISAERSLASLVHDDPHLAWESLLPCAMDNPEVHRIVLPFRAWEMQSIVGTENALTLLRQVVHYCVHHEPSRNAGWNHPGELYAKLRETYQLEVEIPVTRSLDDAEFDRVVGELTNSTADDAAQSVAARIRDGFDPEALGEALSAAACHLVLCDAGRPPYWEDRGKPAGSVHGDSVGVHASDSANAWRHMATVCRGPARYACLILGAWQIARDRANYHHFLKEDLPASHQRRAFASLAPSDLLVRLEQAIRENMQGQAAAIADCYGGNGGQAEDIFQVLLKYAVSEDGSLHAEKYFNTVYEDFHVTRSSRRWRHVTALARVTASEFGRPAAGQFEARRLLKID